MRISVELKSSTPYAIIFCLFFLATKLMLIASPYSIEELVTFDTAFRVAAGDSLYWDFKGAYGPFPSYFYGFWLRLLPKTVLFLRLITFFICGAAGLLLFALARELVFSPKQALIISLLASLPLATYPSYVHDHNLALLGLVGCLLFLVRALKKDCHRHLWFSFLFLLVIMGSRPAIMGYGTWLGWSLSVFLFFRHSWKKRIGIVSLSLIIALIFFLAQYWVYGTKIWGVLFVNSGMSHEQTISWRRFFYNLVPNFGEGLNSVGSFKHFILLPLAWYGWLFSSLLCMPILSFARQRPTIEKSVPYMLLLVIFGGNFLDNALMGPDPVYIRGQFFFPPWILAVWAWAWAVTREPLKQRRVNWIASLVLMGPIALYTFGWLGACFRIATLPKYTDTILKDTVQLPGHDGFVNATKFINSKCASDDLVLVTAYHPGSSLFLTCRELFADDWSLVARAGNYKPRSSETPFAGDGSMTYRQIMAKHFADKKPRFRLVNLQGYSFYPVNFYCSGTSSYQDFSWTFGDLRVCW